MSKYSIPYRNVSQIYAWSCSVEECWKPWDRQRINARAKFHVDLRKRVLYRKRGKSPGHLGISSLAISIFYWLTSQSGDGIEIERRLLLWNGSFLQRAQTQQPGRFALALEPTHSEIKRGIPILENFFYSQKPNFQLVSIGKIHTSWINLVEIEKSWNRYNIILHNFEFNS